MICPNAAQDVKPKKKIMGKIFDMVINSQGVFVTLQEARSAEQQAAPPTVDNNQGL